MRLTEELRERTKRYASAVIRCYAKLPKDREEVRVLGTSVAAFGNLAAGNQRTARDFHQYRLETSQARGLISAFQFFSMSAFEFSDFSVSAFQFFSLWRHWSRNFASAAIDFSISVFSI